MKIGIDHAPRELRPVIHLSLQRHDRERVLVPCIGGRSSQATMSPNCWRSLTDARWQAACTHIPPFEAGEWRVPGQRIRPDNAGIAWLTRAVFGGSRFMVVQQTQKDEL